MTGSHVVPVGVLGAPDTKTLYAFIASYSPGLQASACIGRERTRELLTELWEDRVSKRSTSYI